MRLTREQMVGVLSCHVAVAPVERDVTVERIVWDSREVEPGYAFLAVPGEHVDGNDFIPQAIDAGAAFVVATCEPGEEVVARARDADAAIAVVGDHLTAMGELASYYRTKLDATVIGVTGSSGKTTTKDIIATILGEEFKTTATLSNQNNELGVPNTVLSADPDVEKLVVEMGMRGMGQIEEMCAMVRPDIGIITNIGTAHEELLGSRENIARAKSELISALPDGEGIAVLNGDDPFTPMIMECARVEERGIQTILYGLGEDCTVRATEVAYSSTGCPSFRIVFPNGREGRATLPLMGQHNVMNALGAAAVAYACDMPIERICNALRLVKPQSMRQEVVEAGGLRIVNDAYNANPDSMRAALSLLQIMEAEGRKIAVLGDMGELGPDEAKLHEDVGGAVAGSGVDLLVTVGELAAHIAAGARLAGMPGDAIIECSDVAAAISALEQEAAPGDVVLVKASRFMGLEKVVEGLVER